MSSEWGGKSAMVERRVTWHTQYLCWFLPDKQRLRELARVYNEETEAFDRLNTNPGARNRFAAETFRRLKNMAIREGVDGDLLAEIRADLRHFETLDKSKQTNQHPTQ